MTERLPVIPADAILIHGHRVWITVPGVGMRDGWNITNVDLEATRQIGSIIRIMIMTVIPNQDISKLTRAVHQSDPKAFLIIHEAFHVLGEGYTPIEKIASSSDVTQH